MISDRVATAKLKKPLFAMSTPRIAATDGLKIAGMPTMIRVGATKPRVIIRPSLRTNLSTDRLFICALKGDPAADSITEPKSGHLLFNQLGLENFYVWHRTHRVIS